MFAAARRVRCLITKAEEGSGSGPGSGTTLFGVSASRKPSTHLRTNRMLAVGRAGVLASFFLEIPWEISVHDLVIRGWFGGDLGFGYNTPYSVVVCRCLDTNFWISVEADPLLGKKEYQLSTKEDKGQTAVSLAPISIYSISQNSQSLVSPRHAICSRSQGKSTFS